MDPPVLQHVLLHRVRTGQEYIRARPKIGPIGFRPLDMDLVEEITDIDITKAVPDKEDAPP